MGRSQIEECVDCSGISVFYSAETNGAGLQTKENMLRTVRSLFPKRIFENCYEWCSGPGFYGYTLLGAGICKSLFLADIYEPAVSQANKTAKSNGLLDKVHILNSNNWDGFSNHQKFDLIVGNPPHFNVHNYYNEIWQFTSRVYFDQDWQIHREFFSKAKIHLAPDGEILLLECAWGSGVNTFQVMIDDAGLRIKKHFLSEYKHEKFGEPLYYLSIGHA